MVSTPSGQCFTQPDLGRVLKQLKNINAIDNIDAEYEALCASYSLVSA